jgi:Cu(I)/Ag(I) efflux system protein CusF
MKRTNLPAAVAALALLLGAAPALAEDPHAGHGMTMTDAAAGEEVSVKAVINSIDAAKLMANVTHEPIPALHWPQMTMDLPLTAKVDLAAVKPGMNAVISIKHGRDGQFRITSIKPAE